MLIEKTMINRIQSFSLLKYFFIFCITKKQMMNENKFNPGIPTLKASFKKPQRPAKTNPVRNEKYKIQKIANMNIISGLILKKLMEDSTLIWTNVLIKISNKAMSFSTLLFG